MMNVSPQIRTMVEEAGFENVQHDIFKVRISSNRIVILDTPLTRNEHIRTCVRSVSE